MKRLVVVGAALVLMLAAGCSSSKHDDGAQTGTSAAAAGGSTTTTFAGGPDASQACAAILGLGTVRDTAQSSNAEAATKLEQYAQQIRDSAPSSVTDAAHAYADLVAAAATAMQSSSDPAIVSPALAALASGASSPAVLPYITWVSQNCQTTANGATSGN